MTKSITNYIIKNISKTKQYSETNLEEIRYGIAALIILLSKSIWIFSLATIFNSLKVTLLFSAIFGSVKLFSFGLHMKNSLWCLFFSILIFVFFPILILKIHFFTFVKQIICILSILFMFKNAPADTIKRPIISMTRRSLYKITAVIITVIYSFIIILSKNQLLVNLSILALMIQNFLISSIGYKLFRTPYSNYKKHRKEEI